MTTQTKKYTLNKLREGWINGKPIYLYTIWNEETQQPIKDFNGMDYINNREAKRKAKEFLNTLK